jgi:hypothetical protein
MGEISRQVHYCPDSPNRVRIPSRRVKGSICVGLVGFFQLPRRGQLSDVSLGEVGAIALVRRAQPTGDSGS